MIRKNFPGRKSIRKEAAEARQEDKTNRTNKEQLSRLDKMFGKGKGAKKERARLNSSE